MKKGNAIVIVLIVAVLAVLVLGYLGRHRIKAMLGMTPTPVTQSTTRSSNSAPTDNIYTTKTDEVKGTYLADFAGVALYTYDKDTAGVSNCTGICASLWPAYTSGAVAQGSFPTNISVITRSDGSTQFAWKGMPLYYYANDKSPGDVNGDGVGGVWHLAKP